MSVLYFLILVGVLVVIHEFGHFIAAKMLGFNVLRFSIGFGQPLIRFRGPETEYQLALFPLGGYVRILGEDPNDEIPEELRPRAFLNKPLWQRLVVVFAGPFANFCLPIAIYFVSFAGDTELPAAVVGDVIRDTPADRAGLEPGDQVLSINGVSTRYWHDIETTVDANVGEELRFRIRRGDKKFERYVTPIEYSLAGSDKEKGVIGITQAPFLPQIGVIDPNSPAGMAGLQNGDLILSVNGSAVRNWRDLSGLLKGQGRRLNLSYVRSETHAGVGVRILEPRHAQLITRTQSPGAKASGSIHGLAPVEMFVAEVNQDSPADRAGLRSGDLITHLDGKPVHHWLVFQRILQSRPGHEWKLSWKRAQRGRVVGMEGTLSLPWEERTDEYGNTSRVLDLGARSDFEQGEGKRISIDGRIRYAASRAVEHGLEAIGVMAGSFFGVLRGHAPSDELGGPIMMFRVASVSGAKGWEALFLLIALVSISVGLINLLPIPVLDGGHILIFFVEAITRRPLSLKMRERINVVGLALVGLITVMALRNDVVRYVL